MTRNDAVRKREGGPCHTEARTSSPVRIVRGDSDMQSVSVERLYPVGEGAGYAGGIVSAAVDGLNAGAKVAEILTVSAEV